MDCRNGADAVAVYIGDAADFPNGTPVNGSGLVDALVYDTNDGDDAGLLNVLTPGQPQQNEDDNDNKDFHSNARVPNGGAQFATANYVQQAPTPGSSNVIVAEVFEIQGDGTDSPLVDAFVETTENVVTALDTDGFFMQTPTSRTDGNAMTSDGVFVFTADVPGVAVGDHVNVVGQVQEFFGMTELGDVRQIAVTSSGNDLPPVIYFDTTTPSPIASDTPDLERFEGMIVSFDGVATGPSNQFGDAPVVVGMDRTFREPGIEFPGEPGLPVWDGNPEVFEIDPNGLGGPDAEIFANQSVWAEGPLFFTFGDYQVLPTSLVLGDQPNLPRSVRPRSFGELTIGSLNMFRFFDDINDPEDTNFFGVTRNDTVVSTATYLSRRAKFTRYILNVLDAPDILAVQEVEKIEVLQALAADITAADPTVVYTAHLIEGNDVGTIDVGFLVRDTAVVNSLAQIDPTATYFNSVSMQEEVLNDRPALLLHATSVEEGASGQPVRVIVVHNRSLSRVDDPVQGVRVRLKRFLQAEAVAKEVQALQEASSAPLVVVGDFNAFEFSDGFGDSVGQIRGDFVPADNLVCATETCVDQVEPNLSNQVTNLPTDERYSFNFGGNSQALDHALTTVETDPVVRGFEFGRGNSDVPNTLLGDDQTALRSSDHDGFVLYLAKDSDQDNVIDEDDFCPRTSIPESVPTVRLRPNRWALVDGDFEFDTKPWKWWWYGRHRDFSFTTTDTAGCSCEQIIDAIGLGRGQKKFGCSTGVMLYWSWFARWY